MALLELLEHLRSPLFTTLNMVFTVMGEGIFIICILCLIFWCVDKSFGYRLCFIFITSSLSVQTLKISLRIERPFILNTDLNPVEAAKTTATGYSFPSGHTQGATSLFLTLFLNSKRLLFKIIFILPIILVAFSRMYLGVHTPYDVCVSFVISALITMFIDYLFDNYALDRQHKKWIFLLLTMIVCAIMAYTFYLYITLSDIDIENLTDVTSVAGLTFGFLLGWILESEKIKFNEKATTLPFQVIKYLLGIILLAIIKISFSWFFNYINLNTLISDFLEYMIISFFAVGIYPIIIKRFFTNEEMAYRR